MPWNHSITMKRAIESMLPHGVTKVETCQQTCQPFNADDLRHLDKYWEKPSRCLIGWDFVISVNDLLTNCLILACFLSANGHQQSSSENSEYQTLIYALRKTTNISDHSIWERFPHFHPQVFSLQVLHMIVLSYKVHVSARENDGTEREAQGVGRDMSRPRKLFLDERKSVFRDVRM